MKTEITKINRNNPEKDFIQRAAQIIKNGGLVAFPTETVYGLGADAINPEAVKKIFRAKGRPADDPLIVHIANKNELKKLVKVIPLKAKKLIKKFWPGPLTLIFEKKKLIPNVVTAKLPTVAIRMPDNLIAQALIKKSGTPIAAPSANLFGKPSPTTAKHVIHDLKGKIHLILDAGATKIGVESTVLDVSVDPPVLLRPGGLSTEAIQKTIGKINIHPSVKERMALGVTKSPGMKYKHYAPRAKVILIEGDPNETKKHAKLLAQIYKKQGKKTEILFLSSDPFYAAKYLFRLLRQLDKQGIEVIIVPGIETKGLGLAVMNRLKRAADEIIKTGHLPTH